MKKIFGIVCAAIMALLVAGCASTNKTVGSSITTSAAQQNKNQDAPLWAGITLTTSELMKAPEDKRVWNGYVAEEGLLFSGESQQFGNRNTTTTAAELNAKSQIAVYIRQKIYDYQKNATNVDNGNTTQGLSTGTGTAVAAKITGIRRVDRYITGNEYVYVLMFVSNQNIQDAVKDTSMSDYERRLLDAVFPVGATVTE